MFASVLQQYLFALCIQGVIYKSAAEISQLQLICWFLVKCRELFKGNEDHELSSKISCKNKAPNNENVII
ncbi:unnamed protein product [Wuchereria bancrofti]|uniref:Uncharacterized protein n=1 Tax=Wuchereria bancrofti TaxID=6293 RepID=A0A3P7EKZ0_WUCBA|nr:unnamed protein product [Wuchereria bancrofti]